MTTSKLEETIEDLRKRIEKMERLLGLDVGSFGDDSFEDKVYEALRLGARRGMDLPEHTHR